MADDSLSPAEMEMLASAGKTAPQAAPVSSQRGRLLATPASLPMRRPEPQPDRLRESELAGVRPRYQQFALAAASVLSTMLRCRCEVRAAAMQQLTYGEFLRAQETPTCVAVLRAAPRGGELALVIPLGLLFPMLDRLLGGGREPGPIERRPLTTIERRLATRLCSALAEQWAAGWRELAECECAVERVECDARAVQLAPPTGSIVAASYDVSMPGASAKMTLGVAASTVRNWIAAPLPDAAMAEASAGTISFPDAPSATTTAASAKLVAQLSPTPIAAADVLKLAVGDIVTTSHPADAPLELRVDGVAKFHVRPGVAKGHKAVQIVDSVDPPAGK